MTTPPPLPQNSAVPRVFLRTLLVRLLMLVVFLGSVALVWWSLERLPPVARELRRKDAQRADLASEVQRYEMSWEARVAERVEAQYQIAQGLLFAGAEEQTRWHGEFKKQLQALAFDAALQLDVAQPYGDKKHKLSLTPALLSLQPSSSGRGLTNSPYERLLQLAQSLEQSRRRVDLLSLSVSSDSNSVSQTRAVLQLWAQEKTQ